MTFRAKYGISLALVAILATCIPVIHGATQQKHADKSSHDDHSIHGHGGHGPEELIHHADTFYRVAMQERGSMKAIKLGLEYLDNAQKELDGAYLSSRARVALQREIDAFREDLTSQGLLHGNTHYGVFPLARFVTPTLFSDPRSSGIFELLDDPKQVAAREAVEELVKVAQSVGPQVDVVFVSDPPNLELENEALYAFNQSARFLVHNRRELAKVLDLDSDKLWPSEGGALEPDPDVLRKLMAGWNDNNLIRSNHLLLVRVREIDVSHGDYVYIAEARVFKKTGTDIEYEASSVLNQYGFCIDRTDMLKYILGLHGLLLLSSLLLYPLLVKLTSHARRLPTWQNTLVFGGGGFLWGRGMIWILAPMLGGIRVPTRFV